MLTRKQFINKVGFICRIYRQQTLKLTLKDMGKMIDVPISTISGFENGKSTNIGLLYQYIFISDRQQVKQLATLLNYTFLETSYQHD